MDFITNPPQQQMQQQFFQNQRYSFGDFDTKKITLFYSGVVPQGTSRVEPTGHFVFNLVEPIIIDKMSDVFLDSFSMANCSGTSASGASFGAVLKFDDINQNNFSNNTAINNAELIVLDEDLSTRGSASFVTAKNKKFNYMGVIQPGKYGTINGKLTDINNEQWENTSAGNLVFSIELVISNKR
jgi:hypothetical protein